MINFKELKKNFSEKKILVIGDLMLDHYIWGKVERISPEAPVPVVNVHHREFHLGGAANVVSNIFSLGATPYLIGLVGEDKNGMRIKDILQKKNISTSYLIEDASRPTTVKTRVIAHNQQVVRVDREDRSWISSEMEKKVFQKYKSVIQNVDAVILEDYNKGFLTDTLIKNIMQTAKSKGKFVAVDPKYKNFFSYVGCTLFKPNFAEFSSNMKLIQKVDEQGKAEKLLKKLKAEYLILTKGEKGLSVYQKGVDESFNIPTFAKKVYDVSGAGDTVIAALVLSFICGVDIKQSAFIANHAASIACSQVGAVPIPLEKLMKVL